MPLTNIDKNIIRQAIANVRLESLEVSQQLKDLLNNKELTTTDILKKIINT